MSDGSETADRETPEIDHDENCAACGIHERADGSRYCTGCREALVTDGGRTITEDFTVEQEIASDRLDELRNRPDRTAKVSVHAGRHPWVRYEPSIEMYEIAEVSDIGNIEVTACAKDDLLNLFAENPVEVKPLTKALYSPPEPGRAHVWKAVDERVDEVTYANPEVDDAE